MLTGKYKRTLTPTKKPTDEDFKKTKADIEQVLKASYTSRLRPHTLVAEGLIP